MPSLMDNISEIPNSSSSILLPSEPPDIRNWFPSYQYESFVLDTYDPIGGSAFQESDLEGDRLDVAGDEIGGKEENLGELGRNSEIDVNHDEQPLNKMPDSICLQSVFSEPPHIKNWFSSYEYESPVLNTADNFEGPVSTESGCVKELVFKERRGRKEGSLDEPRNILKNNRVDVVDEVLWCNKLVKCTNSDEDTCADMPISKLPERSQRPSTLSEPPDIGNWFSSYAYESPESCRFSDKETEAEEDCIVNQLKREKERNSWELGLTRITTEVAIDEKVNSNGVLRFKSSSRDDDEQDSLFLNRNLLFEDNAISSRNKDRVSKRKLILNRDVSENSETKAQREADVHPSGSRDFETKSKSCGVMGKENEVPRNGFVTTKNRPRLVNDNSLSKPKPGLQKCLEKEGTSGNKAMERRVLSNLEQTGKWQCPQNRKPKLGPPLKQLRLERWIHKL